MASINASARTGSGKGAARKLRAAGKVPAVVYGHGDANVPLTLDRHELELLMQSISVENTVIGLVTDGGVRKDVLIRHVQMHPYRPDVLHVDFLQLHAGETLRVQIPVRLNGTPTGVLIDGGVLDQVIYDLEVECLPGNIPELIDIDVSGLGAGESFRVGDLKLGDNVRVIADADQPVASVVVPDVLTDEPAEGDVDASDTPTTSQG
ncbi:MAG TPA: 50S ribosomal protein L25 [Longimicrobium sp.]|nr:50S ribosomal protein L25 [Longimicrobium sp.]